MMAEKIINMYRAAGYTPEQVIEELAIMAGSAMLANKTATFEVTSRRSMSIKIQVSEATGVLHVVT